MLEVEPSAGGLHDVIQLKVPLEGIDLSSGLALTALAASQYFKPTDGSATTYTTALEIDPVVSPPDPNGTGGGGGGD